MSKDKRKIPQKKNKRLTEIKNSIREIKTEANDSLNFIKTLVSDCTNKCNDAIQENDEIKTVLNALNNDYNQYTVNINETIDAIAKTTSEITTVKASQTALPKLMNDASKLANILSEAQSVIGKDIALVNETMKKYNLDIKPQE